MKLFWIKLSFLFGLTLITWTNSPLQYLIRNAFSQSVNQCYFWDNTSQKTGLSINISNRSWIMINMAGNMMKTWKEIQMVKSKEIQMKKREIQMSWRWQWRVVMSWMNPGWRAATREQRTLDLATGFGSTIAHQNTKDTIQNTKYKIQKWKIQKYN